MEEALLHFIWHRKLFNTTDLVTTQGESVEIIQSGIPNHNQGPDFLQARIRIGDHLWAGHVEIHVRSSMWFLHSHQSDPHYNNVILHAVWVEDEPVYTSEEIIVPCIELEGKIDKELLQRYHRLMNNIEWVPCASSLHVVSDLIKTSWLERLMAERLESKTKYLTEILLQCNNDFEQAFFVLLSRHLGAPANSDAMENLALKLSLPLLRKHGDRIDQMEAIFFGVAGMLSKEMTTGYPAALKKEFDFLKQKYHIQPLGALQWKFMRMRPVHFPTIRIAQLAVIIASTHSFVSLLTEFIKADEWISLFMVKPHHAYWKDHYHFKSEPHSAEKRLGKNTAELLVINVIVPFMFFYGKMQGVSELKERALAMLTQLVPEKNNIITSWSECGWRGEDAGQTQALIHLKKKYCDERRCLHCAIGLQLIK